ncbi:MAG TPA: helix-turn-helix transcriptional regulator [Rhizobiaceae bacterium]|jgi:transcriptional regulator with XRE-family HTH domain|nr:helix-turn-helix transcriptional regulator [Rhizobiaceae bacterium]
MVNLRKRFGSLVAAHRRRIGITQEALADKAGVSVDMISKIETGATGARFPVIERLAEALGVDPAELFTIEIPGGAINRGPLIDLTTQLAGLSPGDLHWITGVVEAALGGHSRRR